MSQKEPPKGQQKKERASRWRRKPRTGEMDYDHFAGWATGELIISIGRGDFDTTVHLVLQSAMRWPEAREKFLARMASVAAAEKAAAGEAKQLKQDREFDKHPVSGLQMGAF